MGVLRCFSWGGGGYICEGSSWDLWLAYIIIQ